MSESTGSEAVMPAINGHLAAELIVEGEQWPVFVWTVDHPDAAGRSLLPSTSREGVGEGRTTTATEDADATADQPSSAQSENAQERSLRQK